jgi:hypothetical protein
MSELSTENLKELSKKELLTIANQVFGLNANGSLNKDQLVDIIEQAGQRFKGNENITVVDEDNTDRVRPGYIKVRVQPGRYNPNNRPIFVSHNFRPATIPVNCDVIIPAYYESCLKDALQERYHQDPNTRELIKTKEHSYPYSVLERG